MFWGIVTSMYVGNVMLLILNLPLIGLFTKINLVPSSIMGPIITLVCLVGAYGVNNNPIDVLVMVVCGVFGYVMAKFGYEPAPLVLAFVLGPLMETSLRQSLILSQGSFWIFFGRPISGVLLALAVVMFATPLIRRLKPFQVTARAAQV